MDYHIYIKGGQGSSHEWHVNLSTANRNFTLFKDGKHVKSGTCRRQYDPNNFTQDGIQQIFSVWGVRCEQFSVKGGHYGN